MNIAWPANIFPVSTGYESIPNVWGFGNEETKTFTSYERPGHLWRQQITLPDLSGDERVEMQMFLVELRGQQNRALLPDFAHQRRGAGGGTPVVNGAGQSGYTLAVSGCPASVTWLKRGDYLQLANYELFRVMTDAVTNGSGQVTISIYPKIRTAPASGSAVEINNPRARCRLNTRTASWTNIADPLDGHRVRSGFSLDFIQAFP